MSPTEKLSTETQATAAAAPLRDSYPAIEVKGLEMAYGSFVLMHDINFTVAAAKSWSSWEVAAAARALFSNISSA